MVDEDGEDDGDDEGGEEANDANCVEGERRVCGRLDGFGSHGAEGTGRGNSQSLNVYG